MLGNSRRAFSLIELIVVVGLIALLIALLLPTFSLVREHAYCVKCLARLFCVHPAKSALASTMVMVRYSFAHLHIWEAA
jgi:prepilin-type N-terminal cleavage/methylation domain-containing protein